MTPKEAIQAILEIRATLVTSTMAEAQVTVTKLLSALAMFGPDLEKFYGKDAQAACGRMFNAAQELGKASDAAMRALASAPTNDDPAH